MQLHHMLSAWESTQVAQKYQVQAHAAGKQAIQ
jgi:hypothetical protein